MPPPILLIGLGQLGRVFAGALLRAGHPVIPANRGDDPSALAAAWPTPMRLAWRCPPCVALPGITPRARE